MITSIYQGGLGNLLFQVSFGYISSLKKNNVYKINPSLHIGRGQGNHIQNYLNNIFSKIETTQKIPDVKISELEYDILSDKHDNILLDGFFQKAKYTELYKPELNELFNFNNIKLNNEHNKICTIQIRTGDYLHPHHKNFNVISSNYIKNSINYVLSLFCDIKFYLITDCYELAKKFLPQNFNIIYYNLSELDDLKLMSQSDVCIISNSSFGWWGSFLGKEKMTLSPYKWSNNNDDVTDIYRKNMIKINF